MNLFAAEGGENAGEGKTEPQRQTDSVAPSEVANEIFGGRTNAYKCFFQEKRMLTHRRRNVKEPCSGFSLAIVF